MNAVLAIAREEWRFWLRSRLALASALIFIALLSTTALLSGVRAIDDRHERLEHQTEAEDSFLAQPDRHPHRMVHYGHYAFRAPPPLAVFDPGLDPITGQSIFLEGHRQNGAMLAESDASAELGGLGSLTPAFVYQLFGPLLVILLGHGAMVREREASTLGALLAQGMSGATLFLGKALALLGVVGLMLLPLLASSAVAIAAGESTVAALLLFAGYLLYLSVWGLLTLLLSTLLRAKATVLAALTGAWLAFNLLLPNLAVNNVARSVPLAGEIETNFEMLAELRELGDGHNAADPAFDRLRQSLLDEYDVATVEELPINLRGVVAEYSEAQLTATLNRYAEQRMGLELRQARALERHGWLSPLLAVATASRAIAGTDLRNHQRFLREAEALRFDFVQGLNRLHAEELSYLDDINRSSDAGAEQRTRIAAENWQLLENFRFEPDGVAARAAAALPSLLMLMLWFAALAGAALWSSARIRP
jgi:ABC-2 type transport system permease protein